MFFLIRRVRSWRYVRSKYNLPLYSEKAARRIFWFNNRLAKASFSNWWIDTCYNMIRLESPLKEFNDE